MEKFDYFEHIRDAIRKEGAKRGCRFITVQSREPTHPKSEAYQQGYNTISEITKERLRRAGKKIKEKTPHVDVGFQVWKVEAKNQEFTNSYYGLHKMLLREQVEGLYAVDITFFVSDDEKQFEVDVIREWLDRISVVDREKELPFAEYDSKRLYHGIFECCNRKSFEKHFVFFMKRIEKFLEINVGLRGELAGLESAYQQRLFKSQSYRWFAQCRDIDFKSAEILDGILTDWLPQ